MRSPTPHLSKDSEPHYKLNIFTNHTRSIHWPPDSYRLVFWLDPGGDICEDLNSRAVQADHLPLAVVSFTNLHTNSKEAMDSLCEQDGPIREMDVVVHCPCTYAVHVGPVAGRLTWE